MKAEDRPLSIKKQKKIKHLLANNGISDANYDDYSWCVLFHDIDEYAKNYHQSQLQALKEEGVQLINQVIEGLLHKDDEYQIDFTAQITELREVLNLITNLEDNG